MTSHMRGGSITHGFNGSIQGFPYGEKDWAVRAPLSNSVGLGHLDSFALDVEVEFSGFQQPEPKASFPGGPLPGQLSA